MMVSLSREFNQGLFTHRNKDIIAAASIFVITDEENEDEDINAGNNEEC